MNQLQYGQSISSKIVVGLFFGKKDSIVLLHFYNLVSKADFNFIVKAALKHHLKKDFFKIHIYTDLSSLVDLDLNENIETSNPQRNIIFTLDDGFLFDWIEEIPKAQRANKVKSIFTDCLMESLDVLKNGEKREKEKDFSQFSFEQLQQLMAYPEFFLKNQNSDNTPNPTSLSSHKPSNAKSLNAVRTDGFASLKGLGGGIASRGTER